MQLKAYELSDDMLMDAVRQLLAGKGRTREAEAVLAEVRRRHAYLAGSLRQP